MIGKDMIAQLREEILDDAAQPYRWKDPELLRSLVYAEIQACRRSHLLVDWNTANDYGTAATASTMGTKPLCRLTLVPNQGFYELSPKILQVRRCQLQRMTYPLSGPLTYAELDEAVPDWFGTSGTIGTAGTYGNPTYFLNEPGNTITFVRAPSLADTAYLVVSRLPLIPFTLNTSPEIAECYHEGLLNWAAHLAYMKNDAETFNITLAGLYEKKFTDQFGPLPDAYTEQMRRVLSQRQRMRPRTFGD